MSFLKLQLNLKKHKDLILIEKIKCVDKNEYRYLQPIDQFICQHLDLSKNLKDFKNFSTAFRTLYHPTYLKYYDANTSSLKFKNESLLSENDYRELLKKDQTKILELFNSHSNCQVCKSLSFKHESKKIRKRSKLSLDEKVQISYAIGAKFDTNSILKNYTISLKTFKELKKKILNRSSFSRKRKEKVFTSLTELEQQKIIELVSSNPNLYFKAIQIKRQLKLKCSPQTIRNLLKFKGFK